MATKSLKSRIEALINSLGGRDKPTLPKIRSELVSFALLAEALEDGQATREAKAKIAGLEAALEKSNAELGSLKVQLQAANAEIERFLADRKNRRRKNGRYRQFNFRFSVGCRANTAAVIG